ncbi:MAG: hypothetical protein ACREAY_11225 [Nitrososphaera sp.]|uniref:hypothetical protein n=1 Tax=Nitrososphaera sp. TaxID=1971748 RepID=UPI003D6FAFE6
MNNAVDLDTTLLLESHLCAKMATAAVLSEKRLLYAEIIMLCRMYREKLGSGESPDRHF